MAPGWQVGGRKPQLIPEYHLQRRRQLGDDLQPPMAGALLQLAQIGAVGARRAGWLHGAIRHRVVIGEGR
jgi:hypothetical protein